MKVEWTKRALADLDRFAIFLQDKFPSLASKLGSEILIKAEIIGRNPLMGRLIEPTSDYRHVVLNVLNSAYIFRYRIDGDAVLIMRVWHGRENRT